VVGYGYNFGCTSDAEFLIEWGCALVAGPAPKPNNIVHWNWNVPSVFILCSFSLCVHSLCVFILSVCFLVFHSLFILLPLACERMKRHGEEEEEEVLDKKPKVEAKLEGEEQKKLEGEQKKRVCVFCGANFGKDPAYVAAARQLGAELARRGLELVWGGGNVGLMGAVAESVLEAGSISFFLLFFVLLHFHHLSSSSHLSLIFFSSFLFTPQ